MELILNEIKPAEPITFNYEELKRELAEKTSYYETLVYTDEKELKADKAKLNKLKKVLNDERIRIEKEYMQPFNDFKSKINELIGIIDKPLEVIDRQVKECEEKRKLEKQQAIKELFSTIGFQPFVRLEMIEDTKWLNATVSLNKIEEQMKERMYQIGNDILTLHQLPEFGFEAAKVYENTLDINKAIKEAKRMSEIAKAKAEHEAAEKARAEAEEKAKAEEQEKLAEKPENIMNAPAEADMNIHGEEALKQPEKAWVSFKCLLTIEDAQALGEFFKSRNIAYEQI